MVISKFVEKLKSIVKGKEEGRDRVSEAKEKRRTDMEKASPPDVRSPMESPPAPEAEKRNEPTGSMGGPV